MPTFSMNVGGKLLTLDKPLLMGILNITPDSFYAGSRYVDRQAYLERAGQMMEEGATFIDIGGQSTRPGAQRLSAAEEAERVLPVIETIVEAFPEALLSIDTYHAEVAAAAIAGGAVLINDISAGEMDPAMIPLVARLGVPYVAMHMQGTPANMQDNPRYEDVAQEVFDFFIRKAAVCRQAGIKDLIIDPGFGFGKTIAHNYQLMHRLSFFHQLGYPLMAGISRKSMIYKLLGSSPKEALNGTIALNLLALQQGVQLLRVHDIKPAQELVQLWEYYRKQA